jgi:DNA polymerase-1
MKNLYLVDASNMFFRAFFAIPPMTSTKGMQTNALYGFLSMTLKLMREVKPDYLVYCFDLPGPSFREKLYTEYKANRDEMPEGLSPQIPYLIKLTELLGVTHVEMEGYEADDVIGTLAVKAAAHKINTVIVSGDKDFAQLVKPGISLYDTMKNVRTDSDGVKAKFGIRPDQMIDYLAMVGDSSDNVPGVRGIGPKGACKLLEEFETLDGIYKNIEKIKGATQVKLKEGKESAYMSQELVTIVTDVKIKQEIEDLKMKPLDREPLRELLQELSFKSFEKSLFAEAGTAEAEAPVLRGKAGQAQSVKPGMAVSPAGEEVVKTAAKPVRKTSRKTASWEEEQLDLEQFRARVAPYSEIWALLSERGLYFGYDGKILRVPADEKDIGAALTQKHLRWKGFDLKRVLKALNLPLQTVEWDALLAAYVVKPELIGTFEEVFEEHMGQKLPDLASPADYMRAQIELEDVLTEKIKEASGEKVLSEFDVPLIPVLASMELRGVRIDMDELKNQSQDLAKDIRRLELEIHKSAGSEFNIGSPKQLAQVLFEKLKLPPTKKTKTGFSTDSDVLESLKSKHPVAAMILEYRELTKLKGTYVDAIPALVDSNGRVHTSLNQAATSTGRLSSTNPNLQNIPIRTERGRLVRKAFIADEGSCLISADYSQIELRVLAHMSSDPGLARAFQDDLDIHAATASEVFGVSLQDVTANHRRIAKAVNFGLAYGQGAQGLSDTLDISRTEATEIITRYFKRFSKVKEFMEGIVREGLEKGYVETLFGRRRYLPELRSQNQMLRRAGERAAINAPIQGTASDLVKLAMIRLHESLPIPLLLQVHDELLFECPVGEVAEYCKDITDAMESVYKLSVPLKVNVGQGPNWDDAH